MADRSVRLALPAEATSIGAIQARAWTTLYASVLPAEMLGEIDAAGFAAPWAAAIERPPTARHRVFVALEGERVVGFAATAPSEAPDAAPSKDGEIVAFYIDPSALGAGHGSRLLAACVETLRADRFSRGEMWILAQDDERRKFLEGAGWAADGAHRRLDLYGDGRVVINEVRLHTDVRSES